MAVMGIKDNKCVLIALFLLALATEGRCMTKNGNRTQITRPQTCKIQLLYLPEDAANANAFREDLAIEGHRWTLGRVSTNVSTAAIEDLKRAKVVDTDLATLRKWLMDLEELLKFKIDKTMESINEVKRTTENNGLKLQNTIDVMSTNLIFLMASQRCILAGPGTTFTEWGCFKGFLIESTFIAAKYKCYEEGLRLASLAKGPYTKPELASLMAKMKLKGKFWIDLSYNDKSDSQWRWTGFGVKVRNYLWEWDKMIPNSGADHNAAFLVAEGGFINDKEENTHYLLCALQTFVTSFP